MEHYPPILETPEEVPANKYANKTPPHYGYKVSGVEPYTGSWDAETAKHLLRRCLFGFRQSDVDYATGQILQDTVDALLTNHTPSALPVNDYSARVSDPDCPAGEEWVTKAFSENPQINTERRKTIQSWWIGEMLDQPFSIQEKMVLFWHSFLVTELRAIPYAHFAYDVIAMLKNNSLGNFKTIIRELTLTPGMLLYLNGYLNQKGRPDENYARELFELFTLGKGEDSQYTEDDVREAARVLTGWTIDTDTYETTFIPNRHDTEDKTFSAFFNNTTIKGSSDGATELDDLLDMIFENDVVVSKYIIEKLYRFFVYYVIDEEIEEKVIEPLAETFRDNNWEILPVLQELFTSAHFYDPYTKGAIIKNPMDFLVGLYKNTDITFGGLSAEERSKSLHLTNLLAFVLQMEIGNPPTVSGWLAYYQAPQYHEHWINSVSLPKRNQIANIIAIAPNGFSQQGVSVYTNILDLTETIPNNSDPNAVISYWVDMVFTHDIGEDERATLKGLLLYGQAEDYYWTIAWENYLNDKSNEEYRNTAYYILLSFYTRLFNLPEYQLS